MEAKYTVTTSEGKNIRFTFSGTDAELRRFQHSLSILLEITDAAAGIDFNGYFYMGGLENIICKEMFGHYTHQEVYRRIPGLNRGHIVDKNIATDEEIATIQRIVNRMVSTGLMTVSRSGKMAKLNVSLEDWIERNKGKETA